MSAVAIPIEDKRAQCPVSYDGVERRSDWHTPADCFKLLDVQQRLDDGSGRMKRIEDSIAEVKSDQAQMKEAQTRLEQKLDANSKATESAASATTEILEIITTAKGFFKGAQVIGSVFKWLAGVATAGLALWFTIKGGGNGN